MFTSFSTLWDVKKITIKLILFRYMDYTRGLFLIYPFCLHRSQGASPELFLHIRLLLVDHNLLNLRKCFRYTSRDRIAAGSKGCHAKTAFTRK